MPPTVVDELRRLADEPLQPAIVSSAIAADATTLERLARRLTRIDAARGIPGS